MRGNCFLIRILFYDIRGNREKSKKGEEELIFLNENESAEFIVVVVVVVVVLFNDVRFLCLTNLQHLIF